MNQLETLESDVKVSIPYERESTSERIEDAEGDEVIFRVSIPYERESTCEQVEGQEEVVTEAQFQFPTNGKAHVNTG